MTTPITDTDITDRIAMAEMHIKIALDHIKLDRANPTYNNLSHLNSVLNDLRIAIDHINTVNNLLPNHKE